MKTLTLTLALLTLLCTCGRAQSTLDKLPRRTTNVAFIKGETGYLIDSITIRTTLDTVPYGFPFPDDSLFLDISIFDPVDELIIGTFATGHAFTLGRCWVDAPTADVYLSVRAGRTVVDSVGLSTVDKFFRRRVRGISTTKDPRRIKLSLLAAMGLFRDTPIAADFQEAYLALPNLTRKDIYTLGLNLDERPLSLKKHPRFDMPNKKYRLMTKRLPGRLRKYDLYTTENEPAEVDPPEGSFYILNFYDSNSPVCQREHEMIAHAFETDTLFDGVTMISVSNEKPAAAWSDYVRENNFTWSHYREDPAAKRSLKKKMDLYPGRTYALVNKDNLVVGVYDGVVELAKALLFRRRNGLL